MVARFLLPVLVVALAGATPIALADPVESSPRPLETAPASPRWGDALPPPDGARPTRLPDSVQARDSTEYLPYRQGAYDVHLLMVDSKDGPAPWDEALARKYVEGLDRWFAAATDGKYRFRLTRIHSVASYDGYLCGLYDAMDHAAKTLRRITPGPGATDALPVIVSFKELGPGCDMDGQAFQGTPGAWVRAYARFNENDATTLAHEIGHNLGLPHSASVDLTSEEGWANPKEYGDSSDLMGVGGHWECPGDEGWNCSFRIGGLHGHNRNLLKVLQPSTIAYVPMAENPGDTVDVELVAAASGEPGTQVVYLPWRQASRFFLEYRPAVGLDQYVSEPDGTGAGVHVRMVGHKQGPDGVFDAEITYPDYGRDTSINTVAVESGEPKGWPVFTYPTYPTAFGVGEATPLPDGTTITVLSMTPTRAIVRVARPADTKAPTMRRPNVESSAGVCKRFPCRIPPRASHNGVYPVWIGTGQFFDDDWVSHASISINGKRFITIRRAAPDGTDEESPLERWRRGWGDFTSLKAGSYTIKYTYRDLVGNEDSSSYQLKVG